jgi:predicted RNA-binding Zn ribbon-like protein
MNNQPAEVPPLRLGSDRKPAPGPLELVQGFVNTLDLEDGRDDLPGPAALGAWLAEYGLMGTGEPVTGSEHEQALAVREALRAVLLANNGGEPDPAAIETLNAASKGSELMVRFDPVGEAGLVPLRAGVDGAIARLLTIVARAQLEGTWARFKACGDDTCGWAFYDWSKNRSATWCSMESCGNRAKARAYRERQRSHAH